MRLGSDVAMGRDLQIPPRRFVFDFFQQRLARTLRQGMSVVAAPVPLVVIHRRQPGRGLAAKCLNGFERLFATVLFYVGAMAQNVRAQHNGLATHRPGFESERFQELPQRVWPKRRVIIQLRHSRFVRHRSLRKTPRQDFATEPSARLKHRNVTVQRTFLRQKIGCQQAARPSANDCNRCHESPPVHKNVCVAMKQSLP